MEIPEKKEAVIDEELARAQKSMEGRVDPDPTPAEVIPEPPKDEDITPAVVPPEEIPKVEDKKPDDTPIVPAPKIERPQAYIPMPKYLAEKEESNRTEATLTRERDEALAKVTELSSRQEGVEKDEDIEAFMEETGFDRATVDGFLKLAGKKLLKPEQIEALQKAENIVKEANIEVAFNAEFTKTGEPELKKRFPNATAEQLLKAKTLLDQTAHTADFHDKALDYIIYKQIDEITKIFTDTPEPIVVAPQSKKTIESSRTGAGKQTSVTAKDFEGQTDFSVLSDMDSAERSKLIKDMPEKTYRSFQSWVANQAPGLEVMRNGQKVILK